jgi:hypothetical protein
MRRELSRHAMERLLRGGTWPALAREVAWEAVRATGVEPRCLEWLTSLVEARLAERVDAFSRAAALDADEAVEALSHAYVEVLEWAVGLLDDRAGARRARSERPRLAPLRRLRARSEAALPPVVAEHLSRAPHLGEDEAAA